MEQPNLPAHEDFPDTHRGVYSRSVFGFWVYLMTDLILFSALFAVYLVLQDRTFGGPSAKELLSLPAALLQSCILIIISLTSGMGGAYAHRGNKKGTMVLFGITFLLGAFFLFSELGDLGRILSLGHNWKQSAFLSAYFTIVGTLAAHVAFALLWTIVLLIPVYRDEGIGPVNLRRLTCLKMFWQFINLVWIFVFALVYLMGRI